jgi:PAS domain S-box-containing protein
VKDLESTSILIVEDEKIVAWDIQERLEKLGYKVLARVASGTEAVQMVSSNKPDLVLMDIQIEGNLNGIETAALLYNSFNIPIVYLTAHSDDKTLAQATQTNPFGYLLKPLQARELHTTIQVALQRHQRESLANTFQQWFANTLNSIGEATITTDLPGNVTFMNPSAESLTGWKHSEASGKPVNQVLPLISEVTGERIENPGIRAIRLKHRVNLPSRCLLQSRNGSEISVQEVATPIVNPVGEIIGSVMVLQDTTQRHLADQRLIALNQDLEQSQLSLTSQLATQTAQFDETIVEKKRLEAQMFQNQQLAILGNRVSSIAHDMSNILHPIYVAAELLSRTDLYLDPTSLKLLKLIESGAKRGYEFRKQILGVAE